MEDANYATGEASFERKRVTKAAMPALGAAGLTFSLIGGASAAAVPTADVQQTPNVAPTQALTLGDEEIADVSLATFHVFDKENVGSGVQIAWRGWAAAAVAGLPWLPRLQRLRGCGGCGGCGERGLLRFVGRLPLC